MVLKISSHIIEIDCTDMNRLRIAERIDVKLFFVRWRYKVSTRGHKAQLESTKFSIYWNCDKNIPPRKHDFELGEVSYWVRINNALQLGNL